MTEALPFINKGVGMATKKQLAERDQAREELRKILEDYIPRRVYTILRHVSGSGMSRDISLKIETADGLRDITYLAAQALGETVRERNGHNVIRVQGVGMDMGFHLVYSLSYAVFSTGDLAADNANRIAYTLRQEWI